MFAVSFIIIITIMSVSLTIFLRYRYNKLLISIRLDDNIVDYQQCQFKKKEILTRILPMFYLFFRSNLLFNFIINSKRVYIL